MLVKFTHTKTNRVWTAKIESNGRKTRDVCRDGGMGAQVDQGEGKEREILRRPNIFISQKKKTEDSAQFDKFHFHTQSHLAFAEKIVLMVRHRQELDMPREKFTRHDSKEIVHEVFL